MDKDKIIILVYSNIRGLAEIDVSQYLREIANVMRDTFDDSVKTIVIPIRDGESRVECINPQLLSEEKYKEAEEAVEKIKKIVEEIK